MTLPKDPFMLLSFVNMKMRDNDYEDLEDLCASLDCDVNQVIETLKEAGFEYNKDIRQFR